jgi:tetratricopeptide (TPR) repeat protein
MINALAYLAGLALVLGPVAVRNRAVGGHWSVSTFQAGPNFYIGNHRSATGRYVPLVPGHETPEFERQDATRLAEHAAGRALSPREVSRFWMARAWDEIRADPLAALRLFAVKLLMVLNRYEVADAESLYAYAEASPILRLLSYFQFGVLVPLAAVGITATWPMRRKLWLLYLLSASMILAVALFYVLARYRYPLAPLLILFAAAGVVHIWRAWQRGTSPRRLLAPIVAGLIAGIVANIPVHDERRLNALAKMNLGVALAQAGDLASATEYFAAAVVEHPGSAEAHNNLAQALAISGDFERAVGHYEQAAAIRPNLPGLWYNFGVALEQTGRPARAAEAYTRALQHDPADGEARRALERLRQ